MDGSKARQDIQIPSGTERMAGWLYPSAKYDSSKPGPAIVLAHGLGGIKEMRLDVFAQEFNDLGYTAIVFDYRYNGASTGTPRGLIDFGKQKEDWHAAIKYARALEIVDPEKVALFGTSLSGGHVISVGARDHRIAAIISQCPFTDGLASALTIGFLPLPVMGLLGAGDLLFGSLRPIYCRLVGKPGSAALMNAHDALPGYRQLVPEGKEVQEQAPARVAITILFQRPGAAAADVQCPILFSVCGKDTVAPKGPTLRHVKKAKKGVVKYYEEMGHFSIYVGADHEKAFKDYVTFLGDNLPA